MRNRTSGKYLMLAAYAKRKAYHASTTENAKNWRKMSDKAIEQYWYFLKANKNK